MSKSESYTPVYENGEINDHSSTDEEEPISYNNPSSILTFPDLDLNEDTDEMSNDEEQEERNKPPPLTTEQAELHKVAWEAYTSRSRKLTAEELALVAVYGPPEEEEQLEDEEEDIDGILIVSSSNPTEQPNQKTEVVSEQLPFIPEPIDNEYNDYEQIFFGDSSDEDHQKKPKRRKSKKQPEESDGEFNPPPKYTKQKKTKKAKKGSKNLRNRRVPSPIPEPPRIKSLIIPSNSLAVTDFVPQPFLADTIVCVHCKQGDREEELLLCDKCDAGSWHMFCLDPPLTQLPGETEQWFCPSCIKESTKQKQQEMLELSDIIREKDRVVAQIRANLMKRKSMESSSETTSSKPIEIEDSPEPSSKLMSETIRTPVIIPTSTPNSNSANSANTTSNSTSTSNSNSNLLLLNKSFSINSQNIIKKTAPVNPTISAFWIGPLVWDDKFICKVAVYFPSTPTAITEDLKHNFPEFLKITSTKDFPSNSLKSAHVEIVPEADHATFLYFMHSLERNNTVGSLWLGAIGPNIYFVPNKNKKSFTIYVPVKNPNLQYLMQVGPGQYLTVTSEQIVTVPVQYVPGKKAREIGGNVVVPQTTAFVTMPSQPAPQQQRSSNKISVNKY